MNRIFFDGHFLRRTFLWMTFLLFTGISANAQTKNEMDANGLKQGYWEKKGENGKVKYKGQFKDDVPYGKFKYFDEAGVLSTVLEYSSADTAIGTHFYDNGQKSAYGFYVNQLKEGKWRFYDKNGVLASVVEYQKGVKNGTYLVYNLNGSISRESTYVNDIENGYRKTYDNQGKILTEGQIKDGQMEGMQIWYRSGVINIKGAYKHAVPEGEWIYYDADGKPYRTEHYEFGIKND